MKYKGFRKAVGANLATIGLQKTRFTMSDRLTTVPERLVQQASTGFSSVKAGLVFFGWKIILVNDCKTDETKMV